MTNLLGRKTLTSLAGVENAIDIGPRFALYYLALMISVFLIAPLSPAFSQTAFAGYNTFTNYLAPTFSGATPEDIGVMDRPRPEYDAKGIPLGGFRLFPTMDAIGAYDDDVLRQPKGRSDYYLEETPALRLDSQWGRHFFEVYGGVNNYNYVRDNNLNLTDWNLGSDGRLDISHDANLIGAVSYGQYHEDLESPDTIGSQLAPNRYRYAHGEASGTYQPNRLGVAGGSSIDRYDWQDTPEIGGGTLSNTDRDETDYLMYGKAFYDFSPDYTGFVKATFNSRHFDQFLDRSGFHRSSNGNSFDAGMDLQISHLLAGELYAGYLDQFYDKNVPLPLGDVSGLDYGVNLNWYATPIITVHLNGTNDIQDVTIFDASATQNRSIKLGADYEFRRDLLVLGYLSFVNSRLIGTTRTDSYPGAGISFKYLVNEYASLNVSYNYSDRSSNFPVFNFTDDMVTVSVSLHV